MPYKLKEKDHNKVVIVIPIYQSVLKDYEMSALKNNLKVLAKYPTVFLKPKGLDITNLKSQFPQVGEVTVSDRWLGTKRGIAGYNEMMLSADFYSLFLAYEYMLICHVDAWVFRDELDFWCNCKYDHIASPWPKRDRYTHFPLKQYLELKLFFKPKRKNIHCQMFGRVGNGGFSLRRVRPFYNACFKYSKEISYFNSKSCDLYNEDVFWSLIPKELKTPSAHEALKFAFDIKPQVCFKQNNYQLPMAVHGFHQPKRREFWKQYIDCLSY